MQYWGDNTDLPYRVVVMMTRQFMQKALYAEGTIQMLNVIIVVPLSINAWIQAEIG